MSLLPDEFRNRVLRGDCVQVMRGMPSTSVDFILTDPPYLVRYRSRSGQTIANDDRDDWLEPAFAEMYRLLKSGSFCVSFYGWNAADKFISAWRKAGFRIVGHIVFRKKYASSKRFLEHRHEQAYLLAKGKPLLPSAPLPDIIEWDYTGNRLHPTQKPVKSLLPIIENFTRRGDFVLDPFCGSGSTLVAAGESARDYIGIELDAQHHRTAVRRLEPRSWYPPRCTGSR
ncbi:DNA methyltransferase [Bradyrhizobium sp. G127]|uniref:DNA methyltransferase n=1 Tax=Bradyrhizobium sp. G127 TaxID=2904800 RepID=UPI001EEA0FCE|nr:DNA methyltransferase [Bradyrhizobium sp. G127]MCF2525403.1 DNA methylase [Bradyrhizobium sp. G127]